MKPILYHLPTFLLLTSAAAAAIIPPPLLLLNNSSIAASIPAPLGSPVDPRFTITARFDGPMLQPIPCLMNTVKLLEKLGIGDFWGDMARTAIKFDDHAHVGVVITPEREGGRIGNRFVIWGLGRGVTNMVLLNNFQKVTFALFCMFLLFWCFWLAVSRKISFDTVGHVRIRRDRLLMAYLVPSRSMNADGKHDA